MTDTSRKVGLDLPFASTAAQADLRCGIEAETPGFGAGSPTLADLRAMLNRARSGLSARTYQLEACPAASFREDGVLVVELAVLVWPSRPDLRYTLTWPEGVTPVPAAVHRAAQRRKVWTNGATALDLPWRLERAALSWANLPVVDGKGASVAPPGLRLDQARVVADAAVWGLIVVEGMAVGYRHACTVEAGKFDAAGQPVRVDLSGLEAEVTWTDAAGASRTASAALTVPPCVEGLLAACEDGRTVFLSLASRPARRFVEVAYSACDGHVLGTRVVREGKA